MSGVFEAKVFASGKITIPRATRERMGIEDGDVVAIQVHTVFKKEAKKK